MTATRNGRPGLPRADVSEPVRERLYELLPAFLRYRDQSEPLDSPLRALMAVLERQYRALDRDISRLYDDWFIETCQDWIAPYLADLLGVRGLDRPESWVPGQRTRIANALSYRRLKGTPAVLERVARDVTGWTAVAVPFFERVARNQSLEHVRLGQGRTLDLRDRGRLARFGGPFDTIARRPQISSTNGLEPSPSPRAGYNLADVGLYFYRLQSQPARRRTARKIRPGCYTIHPLGIDQPLFARHRGSGELTEAITEREVPGPLLRDVLAEEVRARRAGEPPPTDHLGDLPAIEIYDPRTGCPVAATSLAIADLSEWRRPKPEAATLGLGQEDRILVALDPELGRLAFADEYPVAGEVEVTSFHAACGDLGGGPYLRRPPTSPGFDSVTVGGSGPTDGVFHFSSLEEALEKRPADAAAARIEIVDSATYGGWSGLDLEITLRPGTSLEIVAAQGETPTFIGDLRVLIEAGAPSRLTLEGLCIGGKIEVAAVPSAAATAENEPAENGRAHKCRLELGHCTVAAPDLAAHLPRGGRTHGANAGIELDPATAGLFDLAVRIGSSIVGRIAIPAGCGSLVASDSILDGGSGAAVTESMAGAAASSSSSSAGHSGGFGCAAKFSRCTVLGAVVVDRVLAKDTVFAEPVTASARNRARFKHCYLASGSTSGRREKCQPSGDSRVELLVPVFSSRTCGQAGYAQLAGRTGREIRAGASNGAEIGAFAGLGNPFREANLSGILEEYLPWGLVPRVFHVT